MGSHAHQFSSVISIGNEITSFQEYTGQSTMRPVFNHAQRVVARALTVQRARHFLYTRVERPHSDWTLLQNKTFRTVTRSPHVGEGFTASRRKTKGDHTSIPKSHLVRVEAFEMLQQSTTKCELHFLRYYSDQNDKCIYNISYLCFL